MKKISIFGADFERSKKIVTNGKFALTAGMPNPIHMGIINRLFTVIIVGFFFSGILIYGVLMGMPELIGADSDIHYISVEAGMLIHNISSFLKPFNLSIYLLFLVGLIPVFWPKKRLSSQLWTYFPFYTAWYFYILGLFLVAWFVISGYYSAFLMNVHIFQAYYIHKYPEEYKSYLKISDREWYSKRYYKKLFKSGKLEEETTQENGEENE